MTFEINNTEATFEQLENGKVKITCGGKQVGTFSAEQLTSLVTISLAARKSAYEFKRTNKKAEREARKAERDAKKAEAAKAKIEALKAKLEKLEGVAA
jgi:hypothetical protein